MTILLSHSTALECLRAASRENVSLAQVNVESLPHAAPASNDLNELAYELRDACGYEGQIDYLVAGQGARGRTGRGKGHMWSGELPEDSFLALGDLALLSSPEFTFLQMAGMLPFIELVQLGYELCGGYAMQPKAKRGFARRKQPLTNPLKLAAFIEAAQGAYGCGKARRALRWIAPNSWSPMETDIALLLCLPTQMGGYQFPLPQLNRRIELDEPYAGPTGRSWCYLDLSWDFGRVALEFNGEEDHTGHVKEGRDRSREILLAQHGVDLTVITSYHVFRADEFGLLARALSQKIGRKFPPASPKTLEARRKLRLSLFARFGSGALIA